MAEKLFRRFGPHYIAVMMVLTRLFGSSGGLLVIYYVELTLELPDVIRTHFRAVSAVVVVVGCTLTVLLALWETRTLRRVLRRIRDGESFEADLGTEAAREAIVFVARHHRHEAWLVPCSCLLPVLIFLKIVDDAPSEVLINISVTVFMGISMALMSTFFAVEHCMQPVIRCLLERGARVDYKLLPRGRLKFRFGLCSTLIIMTTALMIGTLARQRATDIMVKPDNQAEAVANLRSHSLYITVAAVMTGVIYSAVLSNSVASRVARLVGAMEQVAGGQLSERVRPTGNDEIDLLARQFNAMVHQLELHDHTIRDLNVNLEQKVRERTCQLEVALNELREIQTQLTDTAHRAGMAEIATGVLHNVGNVLNSVNISAAVLNDRLQKSRLEDLSRLLKNLQQHGSDLSGFLAVENRGPKLMQYLEKVISSFVLERQDLLKEVDCLTDKIGHIRGIIAAQQNHARYVRFREEVDLRELIESVVAMHQVNLARHEVQLVREFAEVPPVRLAKTKIVQILDNLVKNAMESIVDSNSPKRVISIRLQQVQSDWARISVADTGGGIEPEHLKSVFSYGFTTKKHGNGFGLHSSALAVSEIGGAIRVVSDGRGRGATFVIDLSLNAGDRQAEERGAPEMRRLAASDHTPLPA